MYIYSVYKEFPRHNLSTEIQVLEICIKHFYITSTLQNLGTSLASIVWVPTYIQYMLNASLWRTCLLNQARASLWPACTWFLKTVSVRMSVCVFVCVCVCMCVHVCVCVCPPPRLLITSSMMWCDMDPCDWLNKFYSCYMATVVIIVNGHGLGIGTHHTH